MSEVVVFENLYQEDLYKIPSRVLVVMGKTWEELSDDDKTLLSKILGSVKQTLASVQIVTQREFTVDELAAFNPKHVIAFGSHLKSGQPPYEQHQIGEVKIVTADHLHLLDEDTKKSLWKALRQMFTL